MQSAPRQTSHRAFTLVELTVVIAIILVLVGIVAAVGTAVLSGGQAQATRDTIRLLDNVVFEYGQQTNSSIPSEIEVFAEGETSGLLYPIADAAVTQGGDYVDDAGDVIESTALMLYAARENAPGAFDLATAIDPSFSRTVSLNANAAAVGLPTVIDAFGNPIRFVHPKWDGRYGPYWDGDSQEPGTNLREFPDGSGNPILRRSFLVDEPEDGSVRRGDADEGICQGDRPYFYSAGPDGDPGTITDNVYISDAFPSFPYETTEERDIRNWPDSGRVLTR